MTIDLIEWLKKSRSAYQKLMTDYSGCLPRHLLENAGKCTMERLPYKTFQLFKTLNVVAEKEVLPEKDKTLDEVIEILEQKSGEIDNLIELSRHEKEKFGINGKMRTYKYIGLVKTAIHQIRLVAEESIDYLSTAKINRDQGNC